MRGPQKYVVQGRIDHDENSVFGRDSGAVIMPYEESVDIDDYFDLFMPRWC